MVVSVRTAGPEDPPLTTLYISKTKCTVPLKTNAIPNHFPLRSLSYHAAAAAATAAACLDLAAAATSFCLIHPHTTTE